MSAAEHEVEHVATVTHLPHPAPTVEPPAVVEPADPREPLLPRLVEYWQPPDIWSEKRPSLRDIWLYVRYGSWTQQAGVLRFLGALDSIVLVLPVFSALYMLLWVWERPARRFVAATVAALIVLAF